MWGRGGRSDVPDDRREGPLTIVCGEAGRATESGDAGGTAGRGFSASGMVSGGGGGRSWGSGGLGSDEFGARGSDVSTLERARDCEGTGLVYSAMSVVIPKPVASCSN